MGLIQDLRVVLPGDLRERATRIELAFSAWEADVLPLNYARVLSKDYSARRTSSRAANIALDLTCLYRALQP
jgi:hypothetical protein